MTSTIEPDELKSRLPDPAELFPELTALSGALVKALGDGPIPRTTISLVQLRAAQLAGSTYLTVRVTDELRTAGEPERRITAVATWADAPYFTADERIALELVEAVMTPNPSGERVSDELFARASAVYSDEALWTLTVAIGHFSLFVPVALIGKPLPGRPPGQNYRK
ncbi:carboxymuconolactone decarboxylase family protein [Amycolatopsis albispora]|uniref:Alkylhydroperoxidase n=1 Tax=Amycolatopsis albispora TaxID=1804986 RepID=A0A344L0U2_9PSEU|nr:carboxymuconolactone decarboxylase family protein [Amycolatopsis albispora]AXB41666.1 alkylhydroperoxidase [Amycolatopsis albispora]